MLSQNLSLNFKISFIILGNAMFLNFIIYFFYIFLHTYYQFLIPCLMADTKGGF